MSDIKELNDDELENVTGGMTFTISSLDGGDVFVIKDNPNRALVVMDYTPIVDNNTEVALVDADKSESGWKKGGSVYFRPLSWILACSNYSFELSKKI